MNRDTVKAFRPVSWPTKGASAQTGKWRTLRPVVDHNKCIRCRICWAFCPDSVIDPETIEIDYQYCKGCGVCARECPKNAIGMETEVR